MIGNPSGSDEPLERRIRREFAQCPALRLSTVQAARLWSLSLDDAATALAGLVDRRVLARTAQGAFVRRGGCPACEDR